MRLYVYNYKERERERERERGYTLKSVCSRSKRFSCVFFFKLERKPYRAMHTWPLAFVSSIRNVWLVEVVTGTIQTPKLSQLFPLFAFHLKKNYIAWWWWLVQGFK